MRAILASLLGGLAVAAAPAALGGAGLHTTLDITVANAATLQTTINVAVSGQAPPVANTMTVSDASGSGIAANYPLQFGRPFVKGSIPSGQCPVVAIAGSPVATQADIKNRYPDGSAEYAVIAVNLPAVAANGAVSLGFAPGACNNAPLTQAQMLDASYNFDATESLAFPPMLVGGQATPLYQTTPFSALTAVANGALTISVNGAAPVTVTGINLSGITDWWTTLPAALTTALKPQGIVAMTAQDATSQAIVIKLLVPGGSVISVASTPACATTSPATCTDLATLLQLTSASGAKAYAASTAVASARAMLSNGDYKLWTSGPVAQTVMLGDDSTARKYDLGPGDGFHPFRPRFYATFWPATHQVYVRYVGENDLATELEDLTYGLTLGAGSASPATVYSLDLTGTAATNPKLHWSMTDWTREAWIGAAPPQQVNIDNNLAYLASTRFLPNYDTSIKVAETAMAADYADWSSHSNDPYDGIWNVGYHNVWDNAMGDAGARAEIAPYPLWTAMWLYTGDWRMRQWALTEADVAGSWPAQLRETDPTRRLGRADATGLNPSTGLGHTVSITDRKTFLSGLSNVDYGLAPDRVITVGPTGAQTWRIDGAHQPQAFYPQYVLTGDPWYLQEMYLWAGYQAARYDGDAAGYTYGRGPKGDEGAIGDELRGAAWVGRNRAETAFAAPDADPEKAYFTYLMNDALARWEGGLQITGTPYTGSVMQAWGATVGNHYSNNGGPFDTKPPLLHDWESNGNPADLKDDGYVTGDNTFAADANGNKIAGSYTTVWMQMYVQYMLGRASELGFSAAALRDWSGKFFTDMISNSGVPELITTYQFPVEANATTNPYGANPPGGFLTWAQITTGPPSAESQAWITGNGWNSADGATMAQYFADNLASDGRDAWLAGGLSEMVDGATPGAAQAYNGWYLPTVYKAIPDFATDPKWAIVPRSDTNILPAIPVTVPPN